MKALITRNLQVKYESPTTYGSRDIAKVKLDNRQTDKQSDRQTDRQDENNMPPIYRSRGIKMTVIYLMHTQHFWQKYSKQN